MKNGEIINAVKCDNCGEKHFTTSQPCRVSDLIKKSNRIIIKAIRNKVENEIKYETQSSLENIMKFLNTL